MNLEIINKWLDEEYGCSFTRLEELHDWLVEENIKLRGENQQLKKQKDDVVEYIKSHTENIDRGRYYEDYVETYDLLRMLGEIE